MRECLVGPAGTIGVASATLARYQEFYYDLDRLEVPLGSVFEPERGGNVAENFNRLLRDRFHGEWFWVMGDDHRFRPDTLQRLLAHRVDVVVPVVCRKAPPFLPVLWKDFRPHTEATQDEVSLYAWSELALLHGLVPVEAVGSAGMLLSRRAIESLADPWFELGLVGGTSLMGEDVWLCVKLIKSGFTVYLDLDTTMGHIDQVTCWPVRGPDGRWRIDGVMRDRRMTFVRPEEATTPIPQLLREVPA